MEPNVAKAMVGRDTQGDVQVYRKRPILPIPFAGKKLLRD